jgi:YjbE family integral membrane protein
MDSLIALLSVVAIDVALAGDNAIVVGLAAAGLPDRLRRRAIATGIVAAALLRIVFAGFAMQLLKIIGLMFAGGLLLLWVAWKLWRELRRDCADGNQDGVESAAGSPKRFRDAVTQIVMADVSMSLDNVLAVAGAAGDKTWVMVTGLLLSVALMGLAANLMAKLLNRYRWIGYVGLAIIVVVAVRMIWHGAQPLLELTAG